MTKNRAEAIHQEVVEKEREKDFKITRTDRFRLRTRHFCDSGIIGSKGFVKSRYEKVKHLFYDYLLADPVSSIHEIQSTLGISLPVPMRNGIVEQC